ncbi:hypothetical protein J2W35_004945 [Variovorax boronicumulans]|uniref:hypothetical protein n=1 Tax=Variovorax boronicumulans TaxID=436515 RepID=UPI00277FFB4B|nr:hypothetical protein [Variovorax boronicumulans]MDQ0084576.1 hypothetical protein [Variovorax boronicumulans]
MNWLDALKLAEKDQEKFIARGKKIVKRFRDERGTEGTQASSEDKRYNILWSNVRTQFPAIYSKKPRAQVERRYKDADPVGRTASEILERALQYEIDHYSDFDAALRCSILDRLLPGRGVAWVRFDAGDQITDDVTEEGEDEAAEKTPEPGEQLSADDLFGGQYAKPAPAMPGAMDPSAGMPAPGAQPPGLLGAPAPMPGASGAPMGATPELLALMGMPEAPKKPNTAGYECAPSDYVFWEDFRCSPARTWEEVTWVARRVYMGRKEGGKRFGVEKFNGVPLTHEPIGLDKDVTQPDDAKKAKIWEIWDKTECKVIWQAEGVADPLDTKDDPLELDGFFPCPKPLFATTTTDTLIPVPDYAEYQDQANELDELTGRIGMLVKAVKAVGVFDASQPAIARLMQEGTDNTLIPVENWGSFSTAGGLKGTVDMLPLDAVVNSLNELYKAREACKQVIFEVTGLSDIIRGASMASETATAQQIKSNFASLRLKETTQDVARFASDILSMKAQIMSSLYRKETLLEMSGILQTDDKQYAEQAIDLLRNDTMRNYRIEVAADSMVELDEQAEKNSRMEFLQAVGGFLKEAVAAGQTQPELLPLLGEMLMFAVRSFKAGRPMEAAYEAFIQKMSQPQQPKPSPEAQKLQAQQAQAQADAQLEVKVEQMRGQERMAVEKYRTDSQHDLEAFRAKLAADAADRDANYARELEQLRAQIEDLKSMRQASTQIAVAELKNGGTITPEQDMAADAAALSPRAGI